MDNPGHNEVAQNNGQLLVLKVFLAIVLFNITFSKISYAILKIAISPYILIGFLLYYLAVCIRLKSTGFPKNLNLIFTILWTLAGLYAIKLIMSVTTLPVSFSSFIKVAVIPLFFLIPFRFSWNRDQLIGLLKYIASLSLLFIIFGIMQFFLFDSMPPALTNISIKGDRNDVMLIGDLRVFRITGMLGNALEFSFFLMLIQIIYLYLNVLTRKKRYLFLYAVTLITTLMTLSRYAFGLSALILLVFLLHRVTAKKILLISVFCVACIAFIVPRWNQLQVIDSVSQRLLSQTEDSKQSTETRFGFYEEAYRLISEFPYFITGYNLGVVSAQDESGTKTLHDGFWIALLIEQGVPIFLFYCCVWLTFLFIAYDTFKRRKIEGKILYLLIGITMLAGIVNSAYFNNINSITLFLLLGCFYKISFTESPVQNKIIQIS